MNLDKLSIRGICELLADNQDLKMRIAVNMKQYGGSFVKALSDCIVLADRNNLIKLGETFFEYILEYQPSRWKGKK